MLQIDPDALEALYRVQNQLTTPALGLRLIPSGDACQGWQLQLGWSNRLLADDLRWQCGEPTLIADRHHWPLLRGSQLSLSEKNGETGLSVRLQPASCQCEHSSCEPAAQH